MSTSFEYNYINFGLPTHDGEIQHFRLQQGVIWKMSTPATLIIAMNSMNLIKVGLPPQEVNVLNSIMFEMWCALPVHHRSTDLNYVTHNSLIFMQVGDATNVQVSRRDTDSIVMQPPAIITHWSTCSIKAISLKVSIVGLKKCCAMFSPKVHVTTIMVEDDDGDNGFFHIL